MHSFSTLLNTNKNFTIQNTTSGVEAYLLHEICEHSKKDIIFVTKDRVAAQKTFDTLSCLISGQVLLLPEWDTPPYDAVSPAPGVLCERIKALCALLTSKSQIILITTAKALLQKLPPKEELSKYILKLSVGQLYKREALIDFLIGAGYSRTSFVTSNNEFAVRGGIIDIGSGEIGVGYRIDFLGNKIELIKKFDIASQLSTDAANSTMLIPASEIILSEQNIACLEKYLLNFGINNSMLTNLKAQIKPMGIENFLPAFYSKLETVFDYCDPNAQIVLDNFITQEMDRFLELANQIYASKTSMNKDLPLIEPTKLWLSKDDVQKQLSSRQVIEFSPLSLKGHIELNIKALPKLSINLGLSAFEKFIRSQLEASCPILISCLSLGSMDRIIRALFDRGIAVEKISEIPKKFSAQICIMLSGIRRGAILKDFCLIAEEDIFGTKAGQLTQKQKKLISSFASIDEQFKLNELLVHKDHGVGRFEGLEIVELSNSKHDCLKLCYADNEKLLLPVENMELLSKYSCTDYDVKLDKLGTQGWQLRKARAKSKIMEMAAQLMQTAALRSTRSMEIMNPDSEYEKFCAKFPYIETEDQLRAINDVLSDLASGKPMERLICGDTGFGKTEVVMRAAFVVTQHNKNKAGHKKLVAMICPTTLLCRQHYNVFQERFSCTKVEIRQLSRIVADASKNKAINEINSGQIDIVVGTHALLNEKISYDNLSLLVIDEEHRFGVSHKEKLKRLKKDIHVLSMSATPIPRTLQMALGGIKEFSLIATPPIGRTATKVSLISFDENLIRDALLKEKRRGGQVFYICPRISDLDEVEQKLAAIAPELSVRKVHGQLPVKTLDSAISHFYEGKFDLLLSTSIIESGLDIPRANTIIVHRSDLFGLAQLYQLKGRVGRSNVDSYAYFTLTPDIPISDITLKRLQILKNLDELGAGFSVASHDMELRGFGNLVGEKQSGHIKEVGVELYQQMFEEALNALHAPNVQHEYNADSPQINIDASVLIPESYVSSFDLRLELYNRISHIKTESELLAIGAELIDRFGGPLPKEVEHLLSIIDLKILCSGAFVTKINLGDAGISIKFSSDKLGDIRDRLLSFAMKNKNFVKLKEGDSLFLSIKTSNIEDKIRLARRILNKICQ